VPADPSPRKIDSGERGDGSPLGSDVRPSAAPRVLVAGVGYQFLRDLSFGPVVLERLRAEAWPSGVEIEDLSYGPIAILHNLEARLSYDRIVLIAGVKRGRAPGKITVYRWDGRLPDTEEEIQARIAEAGSGVISLDNLLVVLTWFRRLPKELVVIEVEGAHEDWGEGFSPEVERAIPEVVAAVREQTKDVPARRTLVAGFGSVLLGDDGFGVRVLDLLSKGVLPAGVELLEVGTGGLNLVLTLMNRFSDLVIVDAVRQGRAPGTLCTFHPASAAVAQPTETGVDPHFAEPTRAMGLASALGVLPGRVTVVGCEPGSCELGLELSPEVGRAVESAAQVIREMIGAEQNS
jgi:hydrogenase maturation protease